LSRKLQNWSLGLGPKVLHWLLAPAMTGCPQCRLAWPPELVTWQAASATYDRPTSKKELSNRLET
jgi:hypothetical protein